MRAITSALFAAAMALGAVSHADAVTLTFAVAITGQTQGAPAISDFEVDWEMGAFNIDSLITYAAEVTPFVMTPQSADILSYVGLSTMPSIQTYYGFGRIGGPNAYFAGVEFFQRTVGEDLATPQTTAYYDRQLYRKAFENPSLEDFSEAGFIAYVLRHGPLTWTEVGYTRFETGPQAGTYIERRYTGLANLVRVDGEAVFPFQEPVPEPSTWALMLAGFATIGGALRSRRGQFHRGA